MRTHKQLLKICKKLMGDYTPWGAVIRWADPKKAYPDCSCGCKYFVELGQETKLGADWGVCCNPKSHRCGLLTFEHQGCLNFVSDPVADKEFEKEIKEAKKHGKAQV